MIKIVDHISKELEDHMQKDLVNYEATHGIDVNYKRFYLLASKDSQVVGVLNAYTAFSEIYIDDIWVHSNHRHKGIGRKLITALEQKFENAGFNNINLCTSDFQAPDFYKKCGFQLEFTRKNTINPKLTKYFFVKYFASTKQDQGLLK